MSQGSGGKPGDSGPDSDGDLSGRLARLDRELKRRSDVKTAEDAGSQNSRTDASGFARALRLSSEFVAGIIAGGAIGWGFDYVLGTLPWGLIVFLLLGFAAGVLNVMRSAGLAPKPGEQ
jgi:ATP synthase protein I